MADEPRVRQLLDEILDSERTPEEVCGDCPELLPEVRRRWQRMRLVEAELDPLFPTPGTAPDTITPAPWHPGAELPRIPGYDVESLLGRGGVGVVFKARHRRLNRPVALRPTRCPVASGAAPPRGEHRLQLRLYQAHLLPAPADLRQQLGALAADRLRCLLGIEERLDELLHPRFVGHGSTLNSPRARTGDMRPTPFLPV